MPQSVSVPEKTLEHWSSQYVTYRYKSNAAQWWPARGEDINVDWLPTWPGKAVQLELKTTTVVGRGIHHVRVDLGQLWEYSHRPLGRQPFYAFPWPDPYWPGKLADAAVAAGVDVTDLAFRRSGSGWWFADWMVVLTTAQVAGVLHDELAAHGSKKRGKNARLVRFDLSEPRPVWGASGTVRAPSTIRWLDFWPAIDRCGDTGWPQLIRLPGRLIEIRESYRPSQVLALLKVSADVFGSEWERREQLVTLEPDSNGNYRIARTIGDPFTGADDDEPDNGDADRSTDHRQLVFLGASAFRPERAHRTARA